VRLSQGTIYLPAIFVCFFSTGRAVAGGSSLHLAKAVELRGKAGSAYDAGDYDTAAELARQAKAELGLMARAPAGATQSFLPALYTVRLVPGDRDCLSKIAGYTFVYEDRRRWNDLYRANKATLKHSENVDLILPGEVLVIPSIAGEKRDGSWSSAKDYPAFKGN
jgi:nucleoid-associated protein YgaU